MCSTDTEDVKATVAQVRALEKEGCELIRVAVPTEKAAKALSKIKKKMTVPLIADIHFNPKLAILALENGADKIRINPENIGDKKELKKIALAAKKHGAKIRIGFNEGSRGTENLAKTAKTWIKFFEKIPFTDLVISVKSSSVRKTIEANRALKDCGYPLHIGVTEAGTRETGAIRSAIAVGSLLADGIGDTIRISLAADPVEEVKVAKKILDALDIRKLPLRIIACPTCGRTKADVWAAAEKLERDLRPKNPLVVAILGCGVNVIGESKGADYTLVGVDKSHFTLLKGRKPVMKKATYEEIFKYLKEL